MALSRAPCAAVWRMEMAKRDRRNVRDIALPTLCIQEAPQRPDIEPFPRAPIWRKPRPSRAARSVEAPERVDPSTFLRLDGSPYASAPAAPLPAHPARERDTQPAFLSLLFRSPEEWICA
jgi:hypothetical protein